MNERIIETPLGTVLLFRDLDEDQKDILVIQAWLSDDVRSRTTLSISSAEKVRQLIQDYQPAQAAKYLDSHLNLFKS